ncbi:MAG TPA: hypothetical protein VGR14_19280 [Verrucomicrobiae bacterium]|jgi:hypothetical protein|nr:hypothetical protein [Verrucomicrobiae bacterium]
MGGLILILPIVAFDVWLAWTTGRRQLHEWKARQNWRYPALAIAAGLLLAVWLAFFVKYSGGEKLRVEGFPIPVAFFHLDGETWTRTTPPGLLHNLGVAANFLTGLAAPIIPFKIAEFFKVVKAELK